MNDHDTDSCTPLSTPTSAVRSGEGGPQTDGPPALTPEQAQHDARRVLALHEVGHGLTSWLLNGQAPDLMTIGTDRGHCWYGTDPLTGAPPLDTTWNLPTHEQPPGLRDATHRRIMMALAGTEAEKLAGTAVTGRGRPPCEREAETAAAALVELAPRYKELLAAREATPGEVDVDKALSVAHGLTGDPAATLGLVLWLRAEASRLLVAQHPLLVRLADALQASGVMPAATFLAIVSPSKELSVNEHKSPPLIIGDGVPLFLPEPLTLQHPHCVIATRDVIERHRGLAMTMLQAGALADDRRKFVRDHRGDFRKPTRADLAAQAAATEQATQAAKVARAAKVAQAADAAAKAASAALAAVRAERS